MTLARQIEANERAAWDRFARHRKACLLCFDVFETKTPGDWRPGHVAMTEHCALGYALRDGWLLLRELLHEPSRWTEVHVTNRPTVEEIAAAQQGQGAEQ